MKKIIIITQGVNHLVKNLLNYDDIHYHGIVESAPGISSKNKLIYKFKSNLLHLISKLPVRQSLFLLAKKNRLPYFYLNKYNFENFYNWLVNLKPDLVFVFSMSQLIPEKILSLNQIKFVNLHPSLLPKYRGPNPWFWVYFNFELSNGLTLHYIDKGEDTGDIISQYNFEIPVGSKSPEFQKKIYTEIGVQQVREFLKKFIHNEKIEYIKQPEKSPTLRARALKKNEHSQIIDYKNFDVERIWHILRGTETWLNALPVPNIFYWGQKFETLDFKFESIQQDKIGKLEKRGRYYCLYSKNGIIHLKLNWKLSNLFISLYRKFFN